MTTTRFTQPKLYELNGRRAYVAQILGPDPKYGMQREFCDRRYSLEGKRGLWAKITAPGFYEVSTRWGFSGQYRRHYEVFDGQDWEKLPPGLSKYLPIAAEGPLPGDPGSWRSMRCLCGDPVEHYTPEGFPVCDDEECQRAAY